MEEDIAMLEHAAVGEAGDRALELERQLHDQVHKASSDTRNEKNQTLARIEHRLEAIKKVARSADNLIYKPRVKE